MKKTTTLLLSLMMLFAFAHAAPTGGPQIPYQAVARDAGGNLIVNQTVSLRFTIHDLTVSGTAVFTETGTVTTNEFGLFTYNIGTNASLSGVNWGSGSKFMQVEIDPSGGTSYINMGTQQMLSVPYALYAFSSGNGAGPTGPTGADGAAGANGNNGATGPTGAAGTNGATGPTGANGTNGSNGATGPTGANGTNGANGNDGATGPTGTGIASIVNNGNGTFTVFLSNGTQQIVSGPTGPTGANGTNGAQGPTGAAGSNGANGATGPTGPSGANGINGSNGNTGPTGNNGAVGPTGATGPAGPTGTGGGVSPFLRVSVSGSFSYTVPNSTTINYIFDWQGNVGSGGVITLTLLPPSSYPAGTILYFNCTGYITSAPTFTITSSAGTCAYSAFANNNVDISSGHSVTAVPGASLRLMSDGSTHYWKMN